MWFFLPPLPALGNGYGCAHSPKAVGDLQEKTSWTLLWSNTAGSSTDQSCPASHFKLKEKLEGTATKRVQEALVSFRWAQLMY